MSTAPNTRAEALAEQRKLAPHDRIDPYAPIDYSNSRDPRVHTR